MKKICLAACAVLFVISTAFSNSKEKVEFRNDEAKKKVEVLISNHFFTAFIYPDNMEKQSLYPIMTASGKFITRGYPLNPRPFERTDHPHHVGLWFNFGSVNGLDFWNNSFAIKPEDKPKYGSIRFKKIVSENPAKGELKVASEWVDYSGEVLLNEETTYVFEGIGNLRTIERITKLTAVKDVTFDENKEGLIGLRLDRMFEDATQKPEEYLDANGNVTKVPMMNSDGVNGVYRNANGVVGGDVWGKRSPWVALRADKDSEIITIAILDNKNNLNYPAWSHARGYGLFATNNLGGRMFDKNAEPVKVILKKGESITFKHKIVIGGDLTNAELNKLSTDFK